MKLHGKMIIWPSNLDSTKTRRLGRKLPKSQSVQSPRLEELKEAAKALSIDHETVAAKSRPPSWWEKGGYLIVSKSVPKSQVLRSLATEVRKLRSSREKKG
ncbi:MAG TPA: signal recognition particle subunit SRP19/SEC65 family protein [Candidatus Dormibacteraeota bacterium]|nr:signal recognition particle subunit SRP19/SEC65 family protein [Candidatus Dormibacteraeota bacterium]